jgi:transcriptional regulator with XRE-family HTH domain
VRRDELNRLVQQEVAKIMAERDALVFEPWFRSRQVSYELKRLQSVPEQEKFSIGYERYGCIDCKTQDRPHAGNNLCHRCRTRWFGRYVQIIGEGIKGEPAQCARGTARAEQLLPENAARDGVHRTWQQRGNKEELQVCAQLAKRFRVTPSHIREVALGGDQSTKVATALIANGVQVHPDTLASLDRAREKERNRALYIHVAKRLGVSVSHVTKVARGMRHSEAVSAALKKEAKRLLNGGDK